LFIVVQLMHLKFGIRLFLFLAKCCGENLFWNAGLVPAADTCSTRRSLKNRQMAVTEERGRAKRDLLRDRGKVLSSVHLLRGSQEREYILEPVTRD